MECSEHLSERLIHLDLKSCPLKIDYLRQLFKLFKDWGCTGLLLEWEDTFPYDGDLVDIGSVGQTAYTAEEIFTILNFAKECNLMIVPLVQTFGHLEFVLKTPKWRHLREVPKYCSSMCPSNKDSYRIVTLMIQQMMKFHVDSKFLHIGGDEVWHLGICDECKQKKKHHLFLEHISKVTRFVKQHYSDVTIIMWDDMLRGIDVDVMKEFNLRDFVEPMVWEYRRCETFNLGSDLWDKYSQIFSNVWIASAFKGATGSCQIVPVIGHHISNHEKWLQVAAENSHKFECIRGIALTGWSRYDHYATLCELLPVGLPSLALCLKTWLNGKYDEEVYRQVCNSLGFTEEAPLYLYSVNRPICIPKNLNFPSSQIYIGIDWFMNLKCKFHYVANSDQCVTWLNQWHVKRNNTSTMQVEHIIINLRGLLEEFRTVETFLSSRMLEVFYEHTIEEWLGCYLRPLTQKLMELIESAESQLKLEQ